MLVSEKESRIATTPNVIIQLRTPSLKSRTNVKNVIL